MTRVMAVGVFDLLHAGHLHYMEQAKSLGDHLTVVVAHDDTAPDAFRINQAGAVATGVMTATSFSGSAVGLTSVPSSSLTGALPSLDGSALTGITGSGSGVVVQHDGSNEVQQVQLISLQT